jgi:hypothetical protein
MQPDEYRQHEEKLRRVLQPGETVLWQGKPQRRAYIWQNYPMFIFGLFWFGFAIFWNAGVWLDMPTEGPEGIGIVFRLFGLPFLIIGFYITFGQLLHRAWEWPKVEYLLTNKRLVILSGLFSLRQVSKFLDAISSVDMKTGLLDRGHGTGTIVIDAGTYAYGWSGQWAGFRFLAISDPEEVLRLIQQAREQARKPPPGDGKAA